MDYKNFTAKTVDEAITQACLDLGVTSDRLVYDVTQEPTKGFLGMGSKPAIIRAYARTEEEILKEQQAKEEAERLKKAAAEKAAKEAEEAKKAAKAAEVKAEKKVITADEIEKRAAAAAAKAQAEGVTQEAPERKERSERGERRDRNHGRRNDRGRKNDRRDDRRSFREEAPAAVPAHEPSKPKPERVIKERTDEEAAVLVAAAESFLKDVFKAMNIEAEMKIEYDKLEGSVNCTFAGEEMGILIGKRGQTLDSLQYLTSLVVNKTTDEYVRVKLDTEDYRSRRAETLNNLARNIAFKVKKTRRPVALEPMNPYERRIIHSALQNSRFVETYSEGEEPYRHVVVAPKH